MIITNQYNCRMKGWINQMVKYYQKTCPASFIAVPITGIFLILLDRYLNGRGTKPDNVKISISEVWLGTYMTVSLYDGRFSAPIIVGLNPTSVIAIFAHAWMIQSKGLDDPFPNQVTLQNQKGHQWYCNARKRKRTKCIYNSYDIQYFPLDVNVKSRVYRYSQVVIFHLTLWRSEVLTDDQGRHVHV